MGIRLSNRGRTLQLLLLLKLLDENRNAIVKALRRMQPPRASVAAARGAAVCIVSK
jgi:hypothetical protein